MMGDLPVEISTGDLTIRSSAVPSTVMFHGEGFTVYEQK
jgi:hypothetical protein